MKILVLPWYDKKFLQGQIYSKLFKLQNVNYVLITHKVYR